MLFLQILWAAHVLEGFFAEGVLVYFVIFFQTDVSIEVVSLQVNKLSGNKE